MECRVRDTQPGLWNITWIDGGTEVGGSVSETPEAGGLVNVTSRFTVTRRRDEEFLKNLTCRATILGKESLTVSVQLQTCPGKKDGA